MQIKLLQRTGHANDGSSSFGAFSRISWLLGLAFGILKHMDEEAYIAAILASPRDDVSRLVYAGWLEERGDVRGEWLRIIVRLQQLLYHAAPEPMAGKLQWVREVAKLQRRMRQLRDVVPEDWALRVQQGHIEHCNIPDAHCPREWLRLPLSDQPARRLCVGCLRWVWFCWSAREVHEAMVSGHPVVKALALDPAEPSASAASPREHGVSGNTEKPA